MNSLLKKSSFAAALLLGVSLFTLPQAKADSNAELSVRVSQIEDQMRQLIGQVEQLSFEMRQLKDQIAKRKMSEAQPDQPDMDAPAAPAQKPRKKLATADASNQGVETIEDNGAAGNQPETFVTEDDSGQQVTIQKAPPPKMLGTLPGSNYDEGQVLVPPQTQAQTMTGGNEVENVALAPANQDTAEALYERSYESLLRRRFDEAESGFRGFLDQYHDHGLAGNAQYWLGETYYVQSDYKSAAQAFLNGVQDFPKGRKAADSLLKLGLSLNRLGQTQQACAAYAAVADKYPKAVEAKKRADAESKRTGC